MRKLRLAGWGLVSFLVGGALTTFAIAALGYLALGFAIVTTGALMAGAANQAFGLDIDTVLVIESATTTLGFAIILYSLYAR